MNILFASQAIDGHFNPMTGVAKELQERGHDVRWYTGPVLAGKLRELGIPLFPFKRAIEHRADNLSELYPERAKLKGPRAIGFDGEKIFASNISSFFEDIRELDRAFPFDVLVADSSMFIHRLVVHLMGKRVVAFVAIPNMESDPLVPPLFFGFLPARNAREKVLQAAAGLLSDKVILRPASQSYRRQHAFYGQEVPKRGRLTDEPYRCSHAVIQTGSRSLDFPRRRDNPNVHYVGALLPYRLTDTSGLQLEPHMDPQGSAGTGFARTVVVTQGTVDNLDPNKLIIPAIEALKDTDTMLMVATAGRGTAELRERYPQANIQIHDYIDFAAVFDHTDVFVTNGGFGGVQLALSKGVPLVVSGINEGKNDVNARVEYAGAGINLRTDNPSAESIGKAVNSILADPAWKDRAQQMRRDFGSDNPARAAAEVVEGVVSNR